MKKYLIALLSAALFGLSSLAFAEVGKKVTFPSFDNGHLYGEKISADDLRGKVVFFEYWGLQCPPCRAAMPHLVELQKKYGSRGFIVIGSHMQFNNPQMESYLKEFKVNFPIYQQKSLPQAPCGPGIPYSVLIGADGRIIAEGQPGQLYDKVEEAVAQAAKGYPILDGVTLDKHKSLAKSIVSNGSDIEAKVAPLRGEAEGGDAEAKAICDAYDAWLENEKRRITRQCEGNPLQAMKSIAALKKAVPSVTDFDEQLASFKENPAYQKLAALEKKVDGLQKRAEKGKQPSAGAVKGLKKSLEEVRGMEGVGLASACDSLESELDAMAAADGDAKKDKQDKKEKKDKKDKKDKKKDRKSKH